MKKIIQYMIFVFFVAVVQSTAFATGDVNAGKWKAQTCLGCHGVSSYTNVYPTYHVPRLGGQHAIYIISALKAYQNGERSHGTMVAQAKQLSEQDMADIAAYFTSFESAPLNPKVKVPTELQDLVTMCSACHSNDGNSPMPMYPKIAGQHEDYLYYSMLGYKNGERTNAIMTALLTTVDEKSMKKLARYFAGHAGLGSSSIGIGTGITNE